MPAKQKKSTNNNSAIEMTIGGIRSRTFSEDLNSPTKEQISKEDGVEEEQSKPRQLHAACIAGNEAVVISSIEKGIDIGVTDEFGRTPLQNAILNKQARIVRILLSKGANVEVKDERGDTPLHTAVRVGDERIIQMLLQNPNCDVNATGRALVTPLHIAAGMDRVNVCRTLIEHQARIDIRDQENMSPMGHAVERGAADAVEYFFKLAGSQRLNVDAFLYNVDMDGSSLLHMAVEGGVAKIVSLCLQNGARVRCPKASDKSTAFHLACALGSLEIVKLLVLEDHAICRITLLDNEGETPLHRAAAKNHVIVAEYLLDQGAAVDPRDKTRCTPLFKAAGKGGAETVQLLLERGADVTIKSLDQRSVLHAAVPSAKVMELLLKVPSSAYLITDKDNKSFTPVHYAAGRGHTKNISLLMNTNKAAAAVTSNELDTPLHLAAKYGWLPVVENLLVGRNIRMINLQNNKGKTPLHLACLNGHDQVTEYLLSQEATIEKDQNKKTALHLAATRGSKRCVLAILNKHPDCLNTMDENKNTALNLAAIEGHDEIVTHLLSIKDQEILMNDYNHNVLDIAIHEEKKNVAMAIAEHNRWREVLTSSSPGPLLMMQTLVMKVPDVAERILDQCITKEGEELKPEHKVKQDFTVVQGKYIPVTMVDQLVVLKTMTKYRRDNCLTHNVVFTLMNLKWKKFGFTSLLLNLLLYLLYLIPLTVLAMYSRNNEKKLCGANETDNREDYIDDLPTTQSNVTIQVLSYVVLVFTLVLLARECKQIFEVRWKYFLSFPNYLELCAYIATLVYILPPYDCRNTHQIAVGAVSMFLSWMNLILYLRKLSFYGSYVIMLATMFMTLFKVLVLFMLFILAFGTTFYILIDESETNISLLHWLLTIFVMTLGELNYADNFMPWDYPFASMINVLFVLFVLAMPIILMNMLVGLAVGDIDNIQKNATMDRYVMQIEMLLEIEQQLPHWLRKHIQFTKHTDFPNQNAPLKSRIYSAICGFGHPGGDEEEEEETESSADIVEIKTKLEQQETNIQEIRNMLRKQSELLEAMSQKSKRGKEDHEGKGLGTSTKSIYSSKSFLVTTY